MFRRSVEIHVCSDVRIKWSSGSRYPKSQFNLIRTVEVIYQIHLELIKPDNEWIQLCTDCLQLATARPPSENRPLYLGCQTRPSVLYLDEQRSFILDIVISEIKSRFLQMQYNQTNHQGVCIGVLILLYFPKCQIERYVESQ